MKDGISIQATDDSWPFGGGATGALMRGLDWSASPLGDPGGWPQSLRAVAELLLQSKFPMFVAWGPELGFLYNDPYAEILGAKHPAAMGSRFHDIWGEIWPDIEPLIDAAMAGEAIYREDLPLTMDRKGYDEQTWFTFSYSPVRDESGAVAGMFCACTETTQSVLAEAALREGEARLQLISDSLTEYAIITTNRRGMVTSWSTGAHRLLGYSEAEALGMDGRCIFTPEDREKGAADREIETALKEGRAANERWHVRKDGSRFWGSGAVLPLRNGNGTTGPQLVKIMRDETQRREHDAAMQSSERHQKLLLAELQHRVRNTLAIVRSIARRTADNTTSATDMLMHFQGRLDAFSRVQAALTRSPGVGVSLMSLIQDELLAHAAHEGETVRLDGLDIELEPKAAERLSLAIHELATNAVKHGAFSVDHGKVAIRWERTNGGEGEELHFQWQETGVGMDGPPPSREGFGMELLRRSLPYDLGAETHIEWLPTGLRFELNMPLGDAAAEEGEKAAEAALPH